MRDTVRYAARLAVYDEHTMSVKSHQLPMTILRATEPIAPSPPAHTQTDDCYTPVITQTLQRRGLPVFSNCFQSRCVLSIQFQITQVLMDTCCGDQTCDLSGPGSSR